MKISEYENINWFLYKIERCSSTLHHILNDVEVKSWLWTEEKNLIDKMKLVK